MKHRLQCSRGLIVLLILGIICSSNLLAQTNKLQKNLPPPRKTVREENLSPVPPRASIPYRPITLEELRKAVPGIPASGTVTLPNHKTMEVHALLDALNAKERELNSIGYSLRQHEKIPVQYVDKAQTFQKRVSKLKTSLRPSVPPPKLVAMPPAQQLDAMKSTATDMKSQMAAITRALKAQEQANANAPPDQNLSGACGYTAILGDDRWGFAFGGTSTQQGTHELCTVDNSIQTYFMCFGDKLDVLGGDVTLSSDRSNSSTYTQTVTVLGIDFPSPGASITAPYQTNVSQDYAWSYTYTIPVCDAITVDLTVGLETRYGVIVGACPAPLYACVMLQPNATATVTFAIGVGLADIVTAGVEGDLNLVNGGIVISGEMLEQIDAGCTQRRLACDGDICSYGNALSGKVDLFVDVGPCPFCKSFDIEILNWDGISLAGDLSSDQNLSPWQSTGHSGKSTTAKIRGPLLPLSERGGTLVPRTK